ncbi:TonB-dependent receptor plug domain-containing protein [Neptunomonas japonica]|uniref:TonB-dependent receptor plug domain-containing protein n=1 Tax=Neptunomonas japonica TaxID=417574 RepID=UPI000406E439|nr:TonB-dependent receptor [Neptunomonas japonica]
MKKTLPLIIAAMISAHAQADTPAIQNTVVIAAKAPVTAKNFAGSVNIVTAADIELSGANNLLEAIEGLPGVSASNVGGGRNGISMRGMETNHTLILVDGRRVSDTDTNVPFSDYQFNWVPVQMIERIEVIRGPMSNLYGSSALGGVINIVTKKAGGKWSTSVTAQGRSTSSGEGGDEKALIVTAAGPLGERADLAFSIEQRNEDAFRKTFLGGNSTATQEGKEITNLTADLGIYVGEESHINLSLITGEEERKSFPDTLYYDIERYQAAVDFYTKVGEFDVKARVYRSDSQNRYVASNYFHNLTEDVVSVDVTGELTSGHQLIAGVEYSSEEYEKDYVASSNNDFAGDFQAWSLFAQDAVDLGDDFTLTFGGRYDDHQRFGSKFSPKIYLGWDVSNELRLKAGYGEGFKAPAVREASDAYSFTYGYPTGPGMFRMNNFLGNSDLEPETNKSIELGAVYSKDALTAGLTVFRNDVDNLIEAQQISSVTSGGTTTVTSRYENVENALITGLEAELGYSFASGLDVGFNYTFLDHEDEDSGNWLTNRSRHEAALKLTQHVSSIDASSQLAVRYVGKQYTDAANTDERPGHTVVDVTLRKEFNKHFTARAGVYNLFDDLAADSDDNGSHTEVSRQFGLSLTGTF